MSAGSLAPCCAHDFYGGFVKADIGYILKRLCQQESILRWSFLQKELQDLKRRLRYEDKRDFSKKLPSKAAFKGITWKHSGVSAFLRSFSFMFTSFHPNSQLFKTCAWKLLLAIKKLCNIIAWKEVYEGDLDQFRSSMCQYLTQRLEFQIEYEQSKNKMLPLLPKNIWALSYGRLAQQMGSMAHLDTQFGEQKNCILKEYGQRAKQTVNVIETISRREVQFNAVQEEQGKRSSEEKLSGLINFDALPEDVQMIVNDALPNVQNYRLYKRLHILGFVFRADSETCVAHENPRTPELSLLVGIAEHILSKRVFFIVKKQHQTKMEHLDIIKLDAVDLSFTLMPSELVFARPINRYKCLDHNNEEIHVCGSYF